MRQCFLSVAILYVLSCLVAGEQDELLPLQTLKAGEFLTAGVGALLMQDDGNLVVCRKVNGTRCAGVPMWQTKTAGNPGAWLQLSSSGCVNIYPSNTSASVLSDDTRLWQSHTMTKAGCTEQNQTCPTVLQVTKGGNVVLHTGTPAKLGPVIWSTNTILPPANAKNVLFLVVDDLRPQMNYAYEQSYMHTPNFDKLAQGGLVFKRSYVQFAVCNPSRNSFMTGRRPDSTMVWNFQNSFRGAGNGPGQHWQTLPQYFRNKGWISVGGGKLFHPCCGLELQDYPQSWSRDIGVDQFWYFNRDMCNDTYGEDPYCEKDCPGDYSSCPSDDPLDSFYDHRLADHTINSLQAVSTDSKERPFFIAAGFRRPHNNWYYPKQFHDLYPDVDLVKYPYAPTNVPPIAFNSGGFKFEDCNATGCISNLTHPMDDYYQKEARRAYYGAVSFTDSEVGRVLDKLEELGLSNDTIVVLFGDHGWQLGEHGEWHKHTNFELATRTPLIIRAPWKAGMGQKTDALVEMVDAFATVAELAGIPTPETLTDGVSFASVLDNPAQPWKNASYSQYARCPQNLNHLDSDHSCDSLDRSLISVMGYSIRTAEWRYTAWTQFNGTTLASDWDAPMWGVELYDHRNDTGFDMDMPSESINLANATEYATVQSALHTQLRSQFEMTLEQITERNQQIPGWPCNV